VRTDIFGERLGKVLAERGVSEARIADALRSGYAIRQWGDPFSGNTWSTVSDRMYGNKQFSSSFEIDKFVRYLTDPDAIERLPDLREFVVSSKSELDELLRDPRRARYLEEGSLWFRGQTKEYTYRRAVPNPVRRLNNGSEISIVPGAYRQNGAEYDFTNPVVEKRSFTYLLPDLVPESENALADEAASHDSMRVEQHYATQTSGLDVTPDIGSALFFATNKLLWNENGQAFHRQIPRGEHQGVIYCFRFCDPPVKESEYLIRDFTLFKTFYPERIIRQRCGLPLFGEYVRNIAVADIDCIIKLANDFDWEQSKTPRHMFPPASEDPFYKKILELKKCYPGLDSLNNVVEYEWANE
jgi:hypothetical protein